jgi:glycosyltransferase involved in cell wall biosynthesis
MNVPEAPRLAIVVSHPTQYYSPWFRWVAANAQIKVRVFYLWDFGVTATRDRQFATAFQWDTDLLSGYEHEFVPNVARDPGTHHFRGLTNPALLRQLSLWSPSAILLFGYKSSSQLRTLWWARLNHVPVLFRGDSHFLGRGAPICTRRWLLRSLYAQFAAFLAVGTANTEYFRVLGVPERRIFRAPHSVNAAHFDPTAPVHQTAAAVLRERLGIRPDTAVVLFAGKFVPAKQPRELLEAFITLRPLNAALVFVGDGAEKTLLEETAKLADGVQVYFLPFANQSEMPSRYLLADIFALPSRGHYETWGLAVNEAMHMGVPALVSNLVGCQRDLVTEGETGWVFNPGEAEDLSQTLRRALIAIRQPGGREAFRQRVRERIAAYSFAATTAGLLAALNVVSRPTSK